jgi:hypothetical protein
MHSAGWIDVWQLVAAIVVRQQPFTQIMMATGAVFFVVMALEGIRTSLVSMWRAHRAVSLAPPKNTPQALAMAGDDLPTESFSAKLQARNAGPPRRKRKLLTLSVRQFSSPRPKITRRPRLDSAPLSNLPENSPGAPFMLRDAL